MSEPHFCLVTLRAGAESQSNIRTVGWFLSLILGPIDSWRFWWRLRGRESVGLAEQLRVQLQEGSIGFVDRAVDRAVAVEPKFG
jgi:hypothetical protein